MGVSFRMALTNVIESYSTSNLPLTSRSPTVGLDFRPAPPKLYRSWRVLWLTTVVPPRTSARVVVPAASAVAVGAVRTPLDTVPPAKWNRLGAAANDGAA